MSKRHAGCVRKVRTYRGADSDSIHYLLFAQFNLRLFTKWNLLKKITREKYNIQKLEDPEVLKRFVQRLQNNIQTNQSKKIKETQTIDFT